MTLHALPTRLPYWVTRTIDTPQGMIPVWILKDGTLVAGYEITGTDTFCSDNSALNDVANAIRAGLNTLPPHGFLQAIYETGHPWRPLVRDFYREVELTDPIMREARKRRAQMFATDPGLTRSRVFYYIGLRNALGTLLPHASSPRALIPSFKTHPSRVRPRQVIRAAAELHAALIPFLDALTHVGIEHRVLSETELVGEAFRALNPSSAKLFPPPVLVETSDDSTRATRGATQIFRGPTLSSQLCLGSLYDETRHVRIDEPEVLIRHAGLQRYPFQTDCEWLFPIQFKHAPSTPMRLSITHLATDEALTKERMAKKRDILRSTLESHRLDNDALEAVEQLQELLRTVSSSDERIFETSLQAQVYGSTEYELDAGVRCVRQAFAATGGVISTLDNLQVDAWLTCLPANGYRARRPYPVVSRNSAHLTPYFQPSTGAHERADYLFTNRQRGVRRLSLRQERGRNSANSFIVGATGSGKTFFSSHLFKHTLGVGGHVMITDNKGPKNSSYRPIVELLGGDYVALNATDADVSFNPCPPNRYARRDDGLWSEGVEFLRDVMCMMTVPNYDTSSDKDLHRKVALDAIASIYETLEHDEATPILSDLVSALLTRSGGEDVFAPIARDMALRLQLWCDDQRRGKLLNRRTEQVHDASLQVFDFFGLENDPELASVLFSALNSRIFTKLQSLPKSLPKQFYFDEAWSTLSQSELGASIIKRGYRVARSYGGAFTAATQSHADVTGPTAVAMLANASIYFLFKAKAGWAEAAEVFELTERQLELYRKLEFIPGRYSEFLYVDRDRQEASLLRYTPTPFELWIDTSSPVDVELRGVVFEREGDPMRALSYLAEHYPSGGSLEALRAERSTPSKKVSA